MEKVQVIIVGGGASGLMTAARLGGKIRTLILERGERVGKKLSATGNGQGNVANEQTDASRYFSRDPKTAERVLSAYPKETTLGFLKELGGCFLPDDRGRIYPSSRQASSVTDLLRFYLEKEGICVRTGCMVANIAKTSDGFLAEWEENGKKRCASAQKIVLCTGGTAAKNFGTDGNGYALAKRFSHTVTPLYPSLVQLKTDVTYTKTLKGIRIFCKVSAYIGGVLQAEELGDVIFTDYGVSGDAIFRISAFLTDKISEKIVLALDLLPSVSKEALTDLLNRKISLLPRGELFCGILNNQAGRCVMKRVGEGKKPKEYAEAAKRFTLDVTGTLGYDYAQVTKGGVPLSEIKETLESRFVDGLYFAGEILDVDGECGGYNLQWAFSSAFAVADSVKKELT